MGCTPSRVQPEQAGTATEPIAAELATAASDAPPSIAISVPDNDVQPFRTASSSTSQADAAAIDMSAAVVRPNHHSQASQSLRPEELSASHTQHSSPRSQAQFSPSSQRHPQSQLAALQVPMFSPPSASSAPRVSILKAPGEKKKKDWDAIRAAKAAASSQHVKSATLEEKELEEAAEEHKEHFAASPVVNILRTQSASSHGLQPHRLSRPQSIPTMPVTNAQESSPSLSQSPSNKSSHDPTARPAKPGSAATSRQNSFRAAGSKKKKRRTSHQGMMSKLALQFPAVRASFAAVYTSFQQFCQMAVSEDVPAAAAAPSALPKSMSALGHISLEKFPALLEHLTHHNCTFTAEQVRHLFTLSHIEHSPTLTFRECLIAVALGYYLAPQPPTSPPPPTAASSASAASADPNFDKIARGFRVIRAAFDEIDDDSSGMLSAEEMKQALFAASSGQSRDDVLQARFRELDINGDGDVEFKEFLYGVVSWVGMTSEEELDDIEQNA